MPLILTFLFTLLASVLLYWCMLSVIPRMAERWDFVCMCALFPVDGLGERMHCDRDDVCACWGWREAVWSLLAWWGLIPLPHLWGTCVPVMYYSMGFKIWVNILILYFFSYNCKLTVNVTSCTGEPGVGTHLVQWLPGTKLLSEKCADAGDTHSYPVPLSELACAGYTNLHAPSAGLPQVLNIHLFQTYSTHCSPMLLAIIFFIIFFVVVTCII